MRLLLLALLLCGDGGWLPPHIDPRPQLVVVSFDGAGDAASLRHWIEVGERTRARFTFFLSGVYLLAGDRAAAYAPPLHVRGASDIGFAIAPAGTDVRANIRDLVSALNQANAAGHEIGSHFNGHFCGSRAGSVGTWGPGQWMSELASFDELAAGVAEHNGLPGVVATFPRPSGARTPCLEGILAFERQALRASGYLYDASEAGGGVPYRVDGVWEIPIPLMEVVGGGYRTLATDYNLYLNQTGGEDAEPERWPGFEAQALASYRAMFWASYDGARAPVIIAHHFEDWNGGAYSRALEQLLIEVCRIRDVRCVSYRMLINSWSVPRSSP